MMYLIPLIRHALRAIPLAGILAIACSLSTLVVYAKPQVVPLQSLQPNPQQSQVAIAIAQVLADYHYTKPKINDALSQQAWQRYLDLLDPNRLFFTQQDIQTLLRYRAQLDDGLVKGRLQPAYTIFRHFRRRVTQQITAAKHLLATHPFDFTQSERYLFDRTDLPWAKNQAALNAIWRRRIKNDLLIERLDQPQDQPIDMTKLRTDLTKRYTNIERRVLQMTPEDVFQQFVNAFTLSIEPHTGYMSPRNSENFDIDMRLSLQGIGAVLRDDNEYTTIVSIVPGGPASKNALLRAGDRIVGVAQGTTGPMQDVMGWRLQDVVDLIRGSKGSTVRLQTLPKATGPSGNTREITLVRDEIKLEDKAASQHILQNPALNGLKIGVIDIPTFYRDFAAQSAGKNDFRSTTRDVRKLLQQLQTAQVDGIVIDLRGNGGGSLTEATELTGLFIPQGPIVQIKDLSGNIRIERDTDPEQVYTGPLAVLVDRNSASASEIFAGAMQDYGRGLILGEPTFGKGTVQTLVDLKRYLKNNHKAGRLRLTMAQFFRVKGASTQHQGVVPDIVFPTAKSAQQHGERALDHALPWTRIESVLPQPAVPITTSLPQLRTRHQQRIAQDPGFHYLTAQEEALLAITSMTDITLHETARRTEQQTRETAQLQRRNQFRQYRGLPPLKQLEDIEEFLLSAENKDPEGIQRIMLDEAALILADAIQQQR